MLSQGFCGAERLDGVLGSPASPTTLPSGIPGSLQHLCLLPLLFPAGSPSSEPTTAVKHCGTLGTYVAFHVVHAQRDALVRVVPLVVLAALAPPAQPVLYHLQEPRFSSTRAHKWLCPVPKVQGMAQHPTAGSASPGGTWCQGEDGVVPALEEQRGLRGSTLVFQHISGPLAARGWQRCSPHRRSQTAPAQ